MNVKGYLWGMPLLLLIICGACKETSTPVSETQATSGTESPEASETLPLTAAGQTFEPPIKPELIPDGAWFCDMGTVHNARSVKGDETCPLCKMKLKEKATVKR